ncbi:hypothetical protein HMPREF3232_01352 [Fannyhessea vaginae]|nr:hypothetical protein HMPREF3232_01352 [Fannyhessea vaginae]
MIYARFCIHGLFGLKPVLPYKMPSYTQVKEGISIKFISTV